jgi:hypothetical protein
MRLQQATLATALVLPIIGIALLLSFPVET